MKQKNNIVNIAIVSNIEFYTKLSIEQKTKRDHINQEKE